MTSTSKSQHPDPRHQRSHYLSLNGPWHFAFDPRTDGERRHLGMRNNAIPGDLTINVPFPWESQLSGVARPDYKGAAWYTREFTVPAEWKGLTPWLHFGAVDWNARVWINGRFAAEHDNGYLPFAIDLRDFVQPGETATVVVRAFDVADAATLVGKQVPWWYTHSSGIWQTVWLEGRAPSHIESLRIEPDVTREQALVTLRLFVAEAGAYTLRLRSTEEPAFETNESRHDLSAGEQEVTVTLNVADPQLWSPETPHLYDFVAELEPESGGATDSVQSYFGMRSISRAQWIKNGVKNEYEYILLNGEPVYLRGALDQAFHPDGLHAYPSDEIIRGDIELAKELGLNMLRCHIKLNDPRYYYWADRLGLLILYDLPSPTVDTPSMRRTIRDTLERAVARDFNSPSIIAWILFNETWGLSEHSTAAGQAWLREMLDHAHQLDPTRLVEDNSPCNYDHVETDINSWHYYINDYAQVRRHIQNVVDQTYPGSTFNYIGDHQQSTAPLINSEYAGIAAKSGDQDIAWSFKYQTIEMRRHAKICGYVYTELTDIEWEHNGFVNYDRSGKVFGYDHFVEGMTVADLNAADVVGLDAPPCQTLAPGTKFRAPLFVSHWGTPLANARVRWQLDFVDCWGKTKTLDEGTIECTPQRFDVAALGDLAVALPDEPGLATVALWLLNGEEIRSRNYVNVEVRDGKQSRVEMENGWAIRFAPGDYVATSWPQPGVTPSGSKFSATGSGWVEYEIALPEGVHTSAIGGGRLLVELSARAGNAKVDWPQQTFGLNYPQTEAERQTPTDVVISLNGVDVETVHLPDDPADARGVLSHHREVDPGSFGYLTEIALEGDALRGALSTGGPLRVRFSAVAGGLSIFGEGLGGLPVGPTVIVERA